MSFRTGVGVDPPVPFVTVAVMRRMERRSNSSWASPASAAPPTLLSVSPISRMGLSAAGARLNRSCTAVIATFSKETVYSRIRPLHPLRLAGVDEVLGVEEVGDVERDHLALLEHLRVGQRPVLVRHPRVRLPDGHAAVGARDLLPPLRPNREDRTPPLAADRVRQPDLDLLAHSHRPVPSATATK